MRKFHPKHFKVKLSMDYRGFEMPFFTSFVARVGRRFTLPSILKINNNKSGEMKINQASACLFSPFLYLVQIQLSRCCYFRFDRLDIWLIFFFFRFRSCRMIYVCVWSDVFASEYKHMFLFLNVGDLRVPEMCTKLDAILFVFFSSDLVTLSRLRAENEWNKWIS